MLSFDGIVSLKNAEWLWQAPFFIAVSVGAGFLGALFNLSRKWLWRVRAVPSRHSLRLMEAVGVGMISVAAVFLISAKAGTCVQVSSPLKSSHAVTAPGSVVRK
jgi:chloride channel 7